MHRNKYSSFVGIRQDWSRKIGEIWSRKRSQTFLFNIFTNTHASFFRKHSYTFFITQSHFHLYVSCTMINYTHYSNIHARIFSTYAFFYLSKMLLADIVSKKLNILKNQQEFSVTFPDRIHQTCFEFEFPIRFKLQTGNKL